MTTKISWATETAHFWRGCHKISEGCKYCYAERLAEQNRRVFKTLARSPETIFNRPLQYRGKVVFVCSESDFFHQDADQWRDDAWGVMRRANENVFLLLTKRILRAYQEQLFPSDWGDGWDHVWVGVSVENQRNMLRAAILTQQIKAKHKFISAEPLLGPLELRPYLGIPGSNRVEWVASGGESGTQYQDHLIRRCNPIWIEKIHADCVDAGAIHYHKQNGGTSKHHGEYGGYNIGSNEYRDLPEFFQVDHSEQLTLF